MPYLQELNPIKDSDNHHIILIIEPSFYTPCYFYFFMKDNAWNVKCYKQIEEKLLRKIAATYKASDPEAQQNLFESKDFLDQVYKYEPIDTWIISDELQDILDNLYVNGLPEPEEKPFGLDGHSYELIIEDNHYRCWCHVPKEWDNLAKVIDKCITETGLDPQKYGCSLSC